MGKVGVLRKENLMQRKSAWLVAALLICAVAGRIEAAPSTHASSIDTARWWWECGKDDAAAVGHPVERAKFLCLIAEAQVGAGNVDAAKETISLAKLAVAEIRPSKAHVGAGVLCDIAAIQARAGDIAAAKATIAGVTMDPYMPARASASHGV